MRRLAWAFLGVVSVLALVWALATYFYKARAAELYTDLSRVSLGDSPDLHGDFAQLVKLQPGLARIEYKYLSQPLEETQSYLISFAMLALKSGDTGRWELAVRLLNGVWLSERTLPETDLARAARLNLFQQRIRAVYAEARVLHRRRASLPVVAGGRQAFAANLLRAECRRRWEDWQLWGGLFSWYRACREMGQMQRWNGQLRAGQPLEAPAGGALKPVYDVLVPLQQDP